MQNCSKSILSPGWVWPREAQASPSLIPKDSPSLPKTPQSIHTEFLKPSPSIPKPPQSIPKHSPSLPKPPRSIPKHSPSLPKHPKLPQRCRASIEQASPSLPEAFPKHSPSDPQAFAQAELRHGVCACVCVCGCVRVCVCVLPYLGLSGPLWASDSFFKALHTHSSLVYIHTYVHIGPIYILPYMYISILGPMCGLIYIHKPPGAHIRLLGHVPSGAHIHKPYWAPPYMAHTHIYIHTPSPAHMRAHIHTYAFSCQASTFFLGCCTHLEKCGGPVANV